MKSGQMSQEHIIEYLRRHGQGTRDDIARDQIYTSGFIAVQCSHLVARGILSRSNSPPLHFSLTDKALMTCRDVELNTLPLELHEIILLFLPVRLLRMLCIKYFVHLTMAPFCRDFIIGMPLIVVHTQWRSKDPTIHYSYSGMMLSINGFSGRVEFATEIYRC